MSGGIYYGWVVVAALFVVLAVSSGLGFYNMSVYMNVLAAERGFSISELSLGVSLFFVVGGVAGVLVAALLDRVDVRVLMIGGAALAGIALGSSGEASELWQLYGLYVLFGIGNAAVSIVTSTTLVTWWFPGRDRSIALSLASTGLSMGGVALTPLSALMFSRYGVDWVMPGIGCAFFLLIAPTVLALLRRQPPARDVHTGVGLEFGWSYARAVRSRFFVLATLGYVFCMAAQVGGIAHLYNRAEGLLGFAVAARAVQVLTIMSILSRILGGFLVRWMSIRAFTLLNLVGQSLGLALVALADSVAGVLLGAGVFGATVGNLLMLHPLWLAEAFGVKAYARIFSLSNAVTVIGVAGGPLVLGVLYDLNGYGLAYAAAACTSMAAALVMLSAGRTPDPGVPGEGEPVPEPGTAS